MSDPTITSPPPTHRIANLKKNNRQFSPWRWRAMVRGDGGGEGKEQQQQNRIETEISVAARMTPVAYFTR